MPHHHGHHGHHGHHHGHHHGFHHRGGPGLFGALAAGALVGGVVASTRHPPPDYYRHGQRYRQVVVIHQPPHGMLVQPHEVLILVTCPLGCRQGVPLEIEVEGRAYRITVPVGIEAGNPFYVRVPKQAPLPPPPLPQAAAAVRVTSAASAAAAAAPAPAPPPQRIYATPVTQQQRQAPPAAQAVYQAQLSCQPPAPTAAVAAPATNQQSIKAAARMPTASVVGVDTGVRGAGGGCLPPPSFANGGVVNGGGGGSGSGGGGGGDGPLEAAVISIESANAIAAHSVSAANPFAEEGLEPPSSSFGDDHTEWVVAPYKAEFDKVFAANGPTTSGGAGASKLCLAPAQVRDALLPLGLERDQLRLVWELSDLDKDGSLDGDEFAVALYLVHGALGGDPVPLALPANVIPPSKRNPF